MTRAMAIRGSHGFALVGAMILIALLALLSLYGYRNALLETRLSDAHRQHTLLFQEAENALRVAETRWVPYHMQRIEVRERPDLVVRHRAGPLQSAIHEADPDRQTPQINIRLLNSRGSIVVGRGTENNALDSRWFEVDAVVFNRFDDAAVKLRSIVARDTGR